MPSYQVTCITRDRADPDWRIDAVGFNGEIYEIDAVIKWLQESDANKLWVVDDLGNSVWVLVRQRADTGRHYLTTQADGRPLNNLASLKEC